MSLHIQTSSLLQTRFLTPADPFSRGLDSQVKERMAAGRQVKAGGA